MHVKTGTTYPKNSAQPSKAWFSNQSGRLSSNPGKVEYKGKNTTPHGGHHESTDRVHKTSMSKASGSKTAFTYPKKRHGLFRNEKLSA